MYPLALFAYRYWQPTHEHKFGSAADKLQQTNSRLAETELFNLVQSFSVLSNGEKT